MNGTLEKIECEVCGSTENLMRHHVSYEPETVQVTCYNCHRKQHPHHGVGLPNGRKINAIPPNFPNLWRNKSYREIMERLRISYATVYNWSRKLGLSRKISIKMGKAEKHEKPTFGSVGIISVSKTGKAHIPSHILEEVDTDKIAFVSNAQTVLLFNPNTNPNLVLKSLDILRRDLVLRIQTKEEKL